MPNRFWCASLLPGLTAAAVILVGCEQGECGGTSGSNDVCPPPVYGFARVTGRVLRSDGTVVVGKPAYVACGDVVGAYSDVTDAGGHFDVRLSYAVFDTLLYPFPPRAANGSFDLECTGSLSVNSDVFIVKSPLVVTFAQSREAVVPTETEWQEGDLGA
jgi:hypothetical protein